MDNVPYSDHELGLIKRLAAKGYSDPVIAQKLFESFGVRRTGDSISRKRSRMGISKPVFYGYTSTGADWSETEVEFVRSNYQTMSDARIALELGNHSASAVKRLRCRLKLPREDMKKTVEQKRRIEVNAREKKRGSYQPYRPDCTIPDEVKQMVEEMRMRQTQRRMATSSPLDRQHGCEPPGNDTVRVNA